MLARLLSPLTRACLEARIVRAQAQTFHARGNAELALKRGAAPRWRQKPDSELAILTLAQVTGPTRTRWSADAGPAFLENLHPNAREVRAARARVLRQPETVTTLARGEFLKPCSTASPDNARHPVCAGHACRCQLNDAPGRRKILHPFHGEMLGRATRNDERDPTKRADDPVATGRGAAATIKAALQWLENGSRAGIDTRSFCLSAQLKRAQA